MKQFEFKYDIGDTVYTIDKNVKGSLVPCPLCETTGRVDLKGDKYKCPRCNGDGSYWDKRPSDFVIKEMIIRQQRMRVEDGRKDPIKSENYVCQPIGEWSTLIYNDKSLFSTREEAEQAIAKLRLDDIHDISNGGDNSEDI